MEKEKSKASPRKRAVDRKPPKKPTRRKYVKYGKSLNDRLVSDVVELGGADAVEPVMQATILAALVFVVFS